MPLFLDASYKKLTKMDIKLKTSILSTNPEI